MEPPRTPPAPPPVQSSDDSHVAADAAAYGAQMDLTQFLNRSPQVAHTSSSPDISYDVLQEFLQKPAGELIRLLPAVIERLAWAGYLEDTSTDWNAESDANQRGLTADVCRRWAATRSFSETFWLWTLADDILRKQLSCTPEQASVMLEHIAKSPALDLVIDQIESIVGLCRQAVERHGLTRELEDRLRQLRLLLAPPCARRTHAELQRQIDQILGKLESPGLEPGEAWSDAALADLNAIPEEGRLQWVRILWHARGGVGQHS
jgi:hypothetical protein